MPDNKQTESNRFYSRIREAKPIISDGAMGTLLHQRGVSFDECFDHLNLSDPALVAEIHREYIEAGAVIIYTNTFGANRYKLARHGHEDLVGKINQAGVELAKRVVLASFKEVFIAGDVGPLGVRLEPFGRVTLVEARKAFSEQIQALVNAGIDLLVIETMTDLYEIREAILAAKEIMPELPVIASMTFTRDDRTLLGDSPAKVALQIRAAGAEIIGANCSGGPNQLLRILKQMRQAVPESFFAIKPNAGWPEQVGGRIMYAAAPEYFEEYARSFWQAGVNIIGGCCGTTPAHISAIHRAYQRSLPTIQIDEISTALDEIAENGIKESPTNLSKKLSDGEFVVAVEMDPPRGLSLHKIIAGASLLVDSGADVINVADSPMARMRMSPWAVCSIIQKETKTETILHFPTRGRNLLRVQGDLLAAHAINVRNVFVVMGDPTAVGDYPDAMDNYDLVPSGLIKLIKQGFNAGVDHAGSDIGQPTSFFIGCALNIQNPDIAHEAKVLNRKIKSGADFILTQPIFDHRHVKRFLSFFEETYGKLSLPLLVGLLPLVSYRHASFLQHEVPGIIIPEEIFSRIENSGDNAAREGIAISLELVNEIQSEVQGIYLMPAFNRFDYAAEIIENIKSRIAKL